VIRKWNLRTPGREEEAVEAGQPALADQPATEAQVADAPMVDAARAGEGGRHTSTT
jgi:hypothetical protein